MKTAVEYAPKFDFNLLEKENKDLHKVYDPIKKDLKKAKKNYREVQLKYDKLMANVNYTKSVSYIPLLYILSMRIIVEKEI